MFPVMAACPAVGTISARPPAVSTSSAVASAAASMPSPVPETLGCRKYRRITWRWSSKSASIRSHAATTTSGSSFAVCTAHIVSRTQGGSSHTMEKAAPCFCANRYQRRAGSLEAAHRQRHQRLSGVQPVLGFLEHDRLRAVDHLVGDLVAPVGGQAVHVDRSVGGDFHSARIADPVPVPLVER